MAVSITSVDTDDSVTATQTGVVIVGTGFGATKGTNGKVEIGTTEQTVTAWSDTSITISIVFGNNKYGASKTLKVTNDASETGTKSITITAPSGVNYVDLTSVAGGGTRVTELGTLETGDQVEWSSVSVGAIGDVTVAADSTYTWAAPVQSFLVRYHDGTSWSGYASEDKEFTNLAGIPLRHGI